MSADRDTLVDLLDQVRAATGPDRELDRDLCIELARDMAEPDGGLGWMRPPQFTASTDAALALTERVLPKQCMQLSRQGSRWFCTFTEDERLSWRPRHPPVGADTLPLAILAALLSALIAQPKPTGMDQ